MPGVDIKKDDMVKVLQGKDRGKEGRVVRVLPSEGRVMVDGVALAKKHMRASGKRSTSGQQLQQGGIIDAETFIDISNVQVVCKCLRQAHPRRPPDRGRREGPVLPPMRGGALRTMADYTPRMKERFREELIPQLKEELGLDERHAGAPVREGRHQHGRG